MHGRSRTPQTPPWVPVAGARRTPSSHSYAPPRRPWHLLTTATLSLLLACTDPRARPAPPQVELSFSPNLVVRSPGAIVGSLYAYDADGINSIVVEIRSEDSLFVFNGPITLSDLFEVTQSLGYNVPGGLAIGTRISLVVTATDFIGFTASDSAFFTVQDTVSSLR